jgi:hypothetical protein
MDYLIPDANGYPNIEVAGEAHREDEIIRALGRSPGIDEEIEENLTAQLVPEPDNPYDKKAISVRVNGQIVGYIERDQTAPYLNSIHRIAASGHTAITNARIWAVKRRNWDGEVSFYSRVSIAMPWQGKATPVNNPPTTPYSLLPWGGALQVSGEEHHFDVLKPLVPKDGEGLLLATMHKTETTLKNGTVKAIVEVRVDGKPIGELSSTTSRHFAPTIDHLSERGMSLLVWARIKGSPVGAEVKIQGARANEIPAAWFDGEPTTIPELVPVAASYTVPPAYVAQAPKPSRPAAAKRGGKPTAAAKTPAKSGAGCAGALLVLVAVGTTVGVAVSNLLS